jgi:hypothetical protein
LVAFKAKDQFNFVDTPKQTGVNSVNEIREIDSRFGLPGPAAGGTQKLIQFCVAHEHLGGCGFPVYHAAILAEMVFDSHQVKPE